MPVSKPRMKRRKTKVKRDRKSGVAHGYTYEEWIERHKKIIRGR